MNLILQRLLRLLHLVKLLLHLCGLLLGAEQLVGAGERLFLVEVLCFLLLAHLSL